MTQSACHILIVEDTVEIREILKMGFEIEGYHVSEAGDGSEALALLKNGPLPDLIILDLLMPNMNGFEFINSVKKDSSCPIAKIPIIVTSAVANTVRKKLPQVQDILSKPIDLDKLLATVRTYCP